MTEAAAVFADLARVLDAMGPALVPSGSDGLLTRITEAARELFGAEACSLALLTDDSSELVFTTASGTGADSIVDLRIPSTQGIAGWVVMTEQPISVTDLAQDARFSSGIAASTGYVPRAILAVPVASPRRLLGVIEVLDRDASRPGAEQDMRLLQLFADQAASAIESTRVFSDLGRAVLGAVAAHPGSDLAEALAAARDAAERADNDGADEHGTDDNGDDDNGDDDDDGAATSHRADLVELATLFAQLDQLGARERRLAVDLLKVLVRDRGGRGPRAT